MSLKKKIQFYYEVYVVQKIAIAIMWLTKNMEGDRADARFIRAFNVYLNSVDRVFNEILEL